MHNRIFWFDHPAAPVEAAPPLSEHTQADVAIVGGGMAGLSAADWITDHTDASVVLIDADHCGSGATGRSSGLINAETELNLHQLARRFGDRDAARLWNAALGAIGSIRHSIHRNQIPCGFLEADSFYAANGRVSAAMLAYERHAREHLGFPSTFYTRDSIPEALPTDAFAAALRSSGTFGMSAFDYCRGLKSVLERRGVRIYEHTPATDIAPNRVRTPSGSIIARKVIACLDHYAPSLNIARREAYHQQNTVLVSEPLDEGLIRSLFPSGPLLVSDSFAVYHYFRPTPDNRLVVGGGTGSAAYAGTLQPPDRSARQILRFIHRVFPQLRDVTFTNAWSAKLGVTRDMLPLAGRLPADGNRPDAHVYVAMCAGGMAWSRLAGQTAASLAVHAHHQLADLFAPDRPFTPLEPLEHALTKPAAFELSNLYSKHILTGHARSVARHQTMVRAAVGLAAAGGVLALAAGLLRARTKLRPTGGNRSRHLRDWSPPQPAVPAAAAFRTSPRATDGDTAPFRRSAREADASVHDPI